MSINADSATLSSTPMFPDRFLAKVEIQPSGDYPVPNLREGVRMMGWARHTAALGVVVGLALIAGVWVGARGPGVGLAGEVVEPPVSAPSLPPGEAWDEVTITDFAWMLPGATGAQERESVMAPTSLDELWHAIMRHFDRSEWERAYRVALCESRGQVDAVGDNGMARGLFQVHGAIHGLVPFDMDSQVAQASGIVVRWGWSPWTCR